MHNINSEIRIQYPISRQRQGPNVWKFREACIWIVDLQTQLLFAIKLMFAHRAMTRPWLHWLFCSEGWNGKGKPDPKILTFRCYTLNKQKKIVFPIKNFDKCFLLFSHHHSLQNLTIGVNSIHTSSVIDGLRWQHLSPFLVIKTKL